MTLQDIDNLDDTIDPNQTGHIDDHMKIARALKTLKNRAGFRKQTIMGLGDSLTAVCSPYDSFRGVDSHNAAPSGGHSGSDWLFQGNLLANSPLDVLGVCATAGYTADQIRTTHLPTVLAAKPTYCTVLAGANDALANGDSYTSSTIAVIQDICNQLDNAGIIPILCTLPPAISPGLSQIEIDRMNAWASFYATAQGYPLLDFYSGLVDTTTGGFKSGYAASEPAGYLHPTSLGSVEQAKALRDVIKRLDKSGPKAQLSMYNGTGQIAANSLLAGSNGTPDGYFIMGTPTLALTTSTFAGNKLSMTRTSADALAFAPSIAVSAGDHWDYCVRIGTTIPAGGAWDLGLLKQDGGTFEATSYGQKLEVPAGTVLHWRGKVSAGTTSLAPFFGAMGVAGTKIEIEQVTLRNMTAKGVVV